MCEQKADVLISGMGMCSWGGVAEKFQGTWIYPASVDVKDAVGLVTSRTIV